MIRIPTWLSTLLAILLMTGSVWAESLIKSVEIRSMPKDGSAFRRFMPDGKVKGGHQSGGRVYEDSIQIDKAKVDEIWALAEDIHKRKLFKGPVVWDKNSRQRSYIIVNLEDKQEYAVSWPEREKHADKKVQKLAELLYKYRVGGW